VGTILNEQKHNNNFRIYLQNIRGIKSTGTGWASWERGIQRIADWQVSMFGCTETNLEWNISNRSQVHKIGKKYCKQITTSTSSSDDTNLTDYQPGGTLTGVVGKWTGRVNNRIQDLSGMGRWSGIRMRGNNDTFTSIITVYRPNKDTTGIITCYQQQWRLMRNNGVAKPEPRQQLLNDLSTELKRIQTSGDEVILMWDANEVVEDYKSALPEFMHNHQLSNLLGNGNLQPATYHRGSKCIDFILGTQKIQSAVKLHGVLRWHMGTVRSPRTIC
jgi:hypothetical protein